MTGLELLTTQDAATITGLSPYTIRAAIRDGELKATKLRGRIRILPDDLAAWIDAGRIQPPAPSTPTAAIRIDIPRPRNTPPAGGARQAVRDRKRAA